MNKKLVFALGCLLALTACASINSSYLHNASDEPVAEPVAEALISRDGRLVYPVRDGIPVLLAEESIQWSQVAG